MYFCYHNRGGDNKMTRTQVGSGKKGVSVALVSALTYAMFFMFAMTTDAVGEIIKIARVDMNLSNTEASFIGQQ